MLLLRSGDVETNPGPKKSSVIKFCHWNLNGLAAHDFLKVSLIEAFITTHNFDIICLLETFLDHFNAKSSKWCNSNKSNSAGIELDNITTSAGYSQSINEPTRFVNKTFYYIDLISSSDLNITRHCGIEKTIHDKYHHDIIYETLNFNVLLPPPY